MIGFLSGKVNFKNPDSVNLLVGGVGYSVYLPAKTLLSLSVSANLDLYTHTHVREDSLELFGFKTQEELQLFKILMGVSGIGAKTALLIIDRGVDPVKDAIIKADVDFFTGIPRLGRKNAQKIIIELKNKVGSVSELDLAAENSESTEVISALQSMGYSRQEIVKAIRQMPQNLASVEEKIRFTLRQLGKGK